MSECYHHNTVNSITENCVSFMNEWKRKLEISKTKSQTKRGNLVNDNIIVNSCNVILIIFVILKPARIEKPRKLKIREVENNQWQRWHVRHARSSLPGNVCAAALPFGQGKKQWPVTTDHGELPSSASSRLGLICRSTLFEADSCTGAFNKFM